jgi:hypothetical protein
MTKRLVSLVLLVGIYAVIRLLVAGSWDAAVVSAIAVATFILDYIDRKRKDGTDNKI